MFKKFLEVTNMDEGELAKRIGCSRSFVKKGLEENGLFGQTTSREKVTKVVTNFIHMVSLMVKSLEETEEQARNEWTLELEKRKPKKVEYALSRKKRK